MKTVPTILAVDRTRGNLRLLTKILRGEGYNTITAADEVGMYAHLAATRRIDLAVIDAAAIGRALWTTCDALTQAGTPFLIIAGRSNARLQQEGLARGARGVLVKPLEMQPFLMLVRSLVAPDARPDSPTQLCTA